MIQAEERKLLFEIREALWAYALLRQRAPDWNTQLPHSDPLWVEIDEVMKPIREIAPQLIGTDADLPDRLIILANGFVWSITISAADTNGHRTIDPPESAQKVSDEYYGEISGCFVDADAAGAPFARIQSFWGLAAPFWAENVHEVRITEPREILITSEDGLPLLLLSVVEDETRRLTLEYPKPIGQAPIYLERGRDYNVLHFRAPGLTPASAPGRSRSARILDWLHAHINFAREP